MRKFNIDVQHEKITKLKAAERMLKTPDQGYC